MKPIKLADFDHAPAMHPPKGYLCVLRDVQYDRYCIIRIKRPNEITVHLNKEFPVEIALAFLADNAKEEARELLELAAAPSEDVWFDLDRAGFQRLREIGAPIRRGGSSPAASPTLASLLDASPPTAPRQRSTAHRRTDSARTASPSAERTRRRSTAHRITNRAMNASSQRGEPSESARQPSAAGSPRRRGSFRRRNVFGFLFLATMLLGILYYVETGRNPILQVARVAEEGIGEALKPNLRVDEQGYRALTFAWDAVPGATSYEYRYRIIGRSRTAWRATTALAKEIRSLQPGGRVVFELRARLGSIVSAIVILPACTLSALATQAPAMAVPSATDLPPTATDPPPTSTPIPPTSTPIPPTNTSIPPPTATDPPPTSTPIPPTNTPTDTPVPTNMPTDTPIPTDTPTNTPTDTPVPSSTPTEAGVRMIVYTLNNADANIRACPSTACAVLGDLSLGSAIQTLERVNGETVYDSAAWYRFDFGGREAFIHSVLVRPSR